jgi:hypothetical protein
VVADNLIERDGIAERRKYEQSDVHDRRKAALNVYGKGINGFGGETEALIGMFATHAAIAMIASDKQSQFASALASRDVIGQAKGMIMVRFDVDAVRAFELLQRLSQDSNVRLADVVARGSAERAS